MDRARIANLDVLFLTSGIWFIAKFLRYAFPPLFPVFADLYSVSNSRLGLAFSGMMLVYALMQFPAGVFADRLGAVRVVAAGVALTGVASLALTLPVSFTLLFGGMILIGLGTGVHKTVAVDLLSNYYPQRPGRALGVHDTFGAFGGVVAPAVVVAVADTAGWQTLFLLGGSVGLALAGGFVVRTPSKRIRSGNTAGVDESLQNYLSLFADRRFNLFLLVTVGFSFAYNGVIAFLPLYLTDVGTLDSATAGLLYSALFAVSIVQVSTGELSDRFSPLRVIVAALVVATAGLCAILLGSSLLTFALAIGLFGLGSHGFRPVRGVYLTHVVPKSLAGGGLGIARTILMGAGAVAPAVTGVVSEYASFQHAFVLLLGALALATVVAVGLLLTE